MSFKTQGNSYQGTKSQGKIASSQLNTHSFSSADYENVDNPDENHLKELSDEEKSALLIKYFKTFKLNKDLEPFERLLSHGVSPNLQDSEGKSLLMMAAEKGSIELVQMLIEYNADVKTRDRIGRTALFYAIEANTENADVVSLLLEYEADVNHEANDRVTPLIRAVEKGYQEITRILLHKGANIHATVESTGDTALHIAVKKENKPMIRLLFEFNCDVTKRNKRKLTPIELCQNLETQELLRELNSKLKDNEFKLINSVIESTVTPQQMKTGEDTKISSNFSDVISHIDKEQNKNQKYENKERDFQKKQKPNKNESPNYKNSIQNQQYSHQNYNSEQPNMKYSSPRKNEENFVNTNLVEFANSGNKNQFANEEFYNNKYPQNRKRNISGASAASGNSDKASGDSGSTNDISQIPNSPNSSGYGSNKFGYKGNNQQNMYQNQGGQQNFNNPNNPNNQNPNNKNKKNKNLNLGNDGTMGNVGNIKKNTSNPPQMNQQPNYPSTPNSNTNNDGFIQRERNNSDHGKNQNPNKFNKNQQPRPFNANEPNQNRGVFANQQNIYPNINISKMASDIKMNMQHGSESTQEDTTKHDPKQQPNMAYNQQNNVLFHQMPGSPNFFMDMRGMFNSYQSQNSFIVNFQPHHGMMGNIPNQQMNQGFIPMNYNPQMNQTTGKNNILPNNGNFYQGMQQQPEMGNPKIQLNLKDPVQQENLKLTANFLSLLKGNSEQQKEFDKINQERNELRSWCDSLKRNETILKEAIKTKDDTIASLQKKCDDLEAMLKKQSGNGTIISREEKACGTEANSLKTLALAQYEPEPIKFLLEDNKMNVDFLKPDAVSTNLHQEIIDFEESVNKFNEKNKPLFDSLIEKITRAVNELAAGAECDIYGSFATGLCLPWSDIDIVIKIPQSHFGSGVLLDSLENYLKKQKWVEDTKCIRNTSVPVLKIMCSKTYANKKVDISIQETRHNGIHCVELVKEYLAMYPPLRPLVLALKQFLYTLGLNDTYSQRASAPTDSNNLGSLLLSFLYVYGFEYDYVGNCTVYPRKPTKGKDKIDMNNMDFSLINLVNQNPPSFMDPKVIIQDPLSANNNVGRSTFQIKEIKNAFMAAYFEALQPCFCGVHKHITDGMDDNKKIICSSTFKRMVFAYQPNKYSNN